VTLFHVLNSDEIEFPFDGMVKFDGLEIPQHLLTRPHMIRPAYRRIVQRYLEEIRRGCDTNRCDYVLMETTKPLNVALTGYLARRLKTKK
jgi:hypothetical protein